MTASQYDQIPQSVLHQYTGGHTVMYGGYIYELCPDHPRANPFGFVPQHRLVVERGLLRYLLPSEIVHHKDEDKTNNSPDNLEVLSRREHRRRHCKSEREKKYPPLTTEVVRNALAAGGLKAAARALGCHTGTIRNQFPDLVRPYKRKSPAKLDDPAWVDKLRGLAADDKVGYSDAALKLGISAESIGHILVRNNIPWVRKSKVGEVHSVYTFRHRKPSRSK